MYAFLAIVNIHLRDGRQTVFGRQCDIKRDETAEQKRAGTGAEHRYSDIAVR